MASEMSEDLI